MCEQPEEEQSSLHGPGNLGPVPTLPNSFCLLLTVSFTLFNSGECCLCFENLTQRDKKLLGVKVGNSSPSTVKYYIFVTFFAIEQKLCSPARRISAKYMSYLFGSTWGGEF